MARPKSEEKQTALLDAAAQVVATDGVGARTAAVARAAGVAEGTLFRYFASKEVLLNELYVHLKQGLSDAMREGFDSTASLEARARSLWNGYVDWGVANPRACKALNQLAVSDLLTNETKEVAAKIFPEVQDVAEECAAMGRLSELPASFANALFLSLADTTMQFAARGTDKPQAYKTLGFEVFWKGLTG